MRKTKYIFIILFVIGIVGGAVVLNENKTSSGSIEFNQRTAEYTSSNGETNQLTVVDVILKGESVSPRNIDLVVTPKGAQQDAEAIRHSPDYYAMGYNVENNTTGDTYNKSSQLVNNDSTLHIETPFKMTAIYYVNKGQIQKSVGDIVVGQIRCGIYDWDDSMNNIVFTSVDGKGSCSINRTVSVNHTVADRFNTGDKIHVIFNPPDTFPSIVTNYTVR